MTGCLTCSYAAAISDVYQDLFGGGSYTGKGIYDVEAFAGALEGRVPDNTLLSHDLFEGIFARTGLVTDINPGPNSASPAFFAPLGNSVVFTAFSGPDESQDDEPWVSDGTEEGTRLLEDLAEGPTSSHPEQFRPAGALVYFVPVQGN